jgi:hypothetical protein
MEVLAEIKIPFGRVTYKEATGSLVGVIFALLGLGLLLAGGIAAGESAASSRAFVQTEGVVTSVWRGGDSNSSCGYAFSFTINGQVFHGNTGGTTTSSNCDKQPGDVVAVRYDPDDPNRNGSGMRVGLLVGIILGGIGAVFAIVGVSLIARARRAVRSGRHIIRRTIRRGTQWNSYDTVVDDVTQYLAEERASWAARFGHATPQEPADQPETGHAARVASTATASTGPALTGLESNREATLEDLNPDLRMPDDKDWWKR